MARRFDYKRMTAQEFRSDLNQIKMPEKAFARIFGFEIGRVQDWATGKQDIPNWVPIVTAMLKNSIGALAAARQEAAERIAFDNLRPEDGAYPYLEKGGNHDAD